MEDGVGGGLIFIDDGEGGGGDDVGDTELFAEGFDERGLAGPHATVEGKDAMVAHVTDELLGGFADMFQIFDLYFHTYYLFSLRFTVYGLQLITLQAILFFIIFLSIEHIICKL